MVVLTCTTAETISSSVAARAEIGSDLPSRTERNATRFLLRPRPGAFVLLLVIFECFDEATEHLGRGLEHRLELGLVDLVDVGAQMIDRFPQPRRHLVGVMEWIAVVFHAFARCTNSLKENVRAAPRVPPPQGLSRGKLSAGGGFGIDAK